TMICVCAPLFCRRSLLVGTNRSAVDHLDVAVVCSGDGVHHPIPYTRLPPPHEAVVAGSARAKPLWQITPRRAGSQHPKNAVQHPAMIDARHSARLVGEKRRDHAPFEVGQAISAHAYAESDFACHANPIYGFTALSYSISTAPRVQRNSSIPTDGGAGWPLGGLDRLASSGREQSRIPGASIAGRGARRRGGRGVVPQVGSFAGVF